KFFIKNGKILLMEENASLKFWDTAAMIIIMAPMVAMIAMFSWKSGSQAYCTLPLDSF
ncbi:hypothetical protein CU098_013099, partial [Rhizopus stolonifer]